MALFSTKSWYTQQSNDSSKGYAIAASDSSYQYYDNMSWSMWVAASPGNSKHLWSLWEQVSGNNRSWLFSVQTDGSFRCLFSWNGTSFSNHKTSTNLADFTWKHLVFTFASGTIGCYVNGTSHTLTQTTAWSGGVAGLHNPAIQHIVTGHSPSAPVADVSPSASFCNFSLWSKVLSSAEVSELYNNGTPYDISTHSAYATYCTNWLRMDQSDSGSTLIDTVTSAANATITSSGTSGVFKQGNNYPANILDLIGQAVWDYPTADANTADSMGEFVNALPSAADVADSVWDEAASGHTTSGSFGKELGTNIAEHDATQAAIAALPSSTAADIADAVWDEATSGHTSAGSFGEKVGSKLLTVAKFLGLK